jgi:hypothetical protein
VIVVKNVKYVLQCKLTKILNILTFNKYQKYKRYGFYKKYLSYAEKEKKKETVSFEEFQFALTSLQNLLEEDVYNAFKKET